MNNLSLEPSIRFKSFNDKWKLLKIYEIGEYITTSNLGYIDLNEDGKFPCVLYGDLYTKYKETIFNIESKTIKMATEIKKNDILFPTSTTVDALSLISPSCVNVDTAVAGGDLFVIRPYDKIEGNFISYCINNNNELRSRLSKRAQGITIIHVQFNNIKDEEIIIPSKSEQKKISELAISIDKLINFEQKKYDKLITIKKSLLARMFPEKGGSVPKIRFKGFVKQWEQRKLSELAKISTGYPFDSTEFNDKGNYLVVTNGNIQNNSNTVDGSFGNRINIEINDARNDYILQPNDILITMDGTVGRTAKVTVNNQILAQRVGRLVSNSNPDFLYHFLNTGKFFSDMKLVSHGGTIKHISLKEIGNFENYLPNNRDEEGKIGEFLNEIDHLIALRQCKIIKLNNIKTALLNKMFI